MILKETRDLRLVDGAGDRTFMQAWIDHQDPYLEELGRHWLQDKIACSVSNLDNPFWGSHPAEGEVTLPEDFIQIGTSFLGWPIIGIPAGATLLVVLVVGAIGSGKSTLIEALAPSLVEQGYVVVILDSKEHHRHLCTIPSLRERSLVFKGHEIIVPAYEKLQGVDQAAYDGWQSEVIGHSYGRHTAHWPLKELVKDMRQRPAFKDGVTLRQLRQEIKNSKVGTGFRGVDRKDSLLLATGELLATTGPITDYTSSDFLDRLFSQPRLVVIENPGWPDNTCEWLPCTIGGRMLFKRRAEGPHGTWIPMAVIAEDATPLLDRQRDTETRGGTAPLSRLLLLGREYGLGYVLPTHSVSTISSKVAGSCGSIFALRSPSEDPRKLANLLGTTPEQTEKIRALDIGEVVEFCPSIYRRGPILGRFQKPDIPGILTEDERRRKLEEFMSGVTAVMAAPSLGGVHAVTLGTGGYLREHVPGHTGSNGKRAGAEQENRGPLVQFGRHPYLSLTEHYELAGWSRHKGGSIVKKLEAQALVKRRTISRETYVALTDLGREELVRMGVKLPKPRTGGGPEHELAAVIVERYGRQRGYRVSFEVPLEGIRIDVKWDRPDGLTYLNISVSRPKREAEKAIQAVSLPAIERAEFILVCRDAKFMKQTRQALQSIDGELAERVKLAKITDFKSRGSR